MNPRSHPLVWKFQKNEHVLRSLLLRQGPGFVYQREPEPLEGQVPVFTFHAVEADRFETQCRFLAENGYRTLTADAFEAVLTGRTPPPPRSLVLSFDDGLSSAWTTAAPILRRYGLNAISFLIPGVIADESPPLRPTLEDVWRGDLTRAQLDAATRAAPLCSWAEIREMHEQGVFEFESHTLLHALVFDSDRIEGFVHPGYNAHFYGNVEMPLYCRDGRDAVDREPVLGMPLYGARPRMTARSRFLDDESVRSRCVEAVREGGGEAFFRTRGWRRRLGRIASEARRDASHSGRFETPEARDAWVMADLRRAREAIEARLPGRTVTQVCWPWYEAADFAVELARETGHRVTYFGLLPGCDTSGPGTDPLRVPRVEEVFLERLPGRGRRSLRDILVESYLHPVRPAEAASPEPGSSST